MEHTFGCERRAGSSGFCSRPVLGGGTAPSPRRRSGSLPRGCSRPEWIEWGDPLPPEGPKARLQLGLHTGLAIFCPEESSFMVV